MKNLRLLWSLPMIAILTACGGKGSSAPAPTGFTVTPQDTQLYMTWDAVPGVEYWVFCDPNQTSINSHATAPTGRLRYTGIFSGTFTATGLTNGTPYMCAVNGRIDHGAGGADVVTSEPVRPRLAGDTWTNAGATGLPGLRAAAVGTLSGTTNVRHVVVGQSGGIKVSSDGATWSLPTSVPSGLGDLNALVLFGDKFVAAGAAGQLAYSTDAATWTSASMGSGLTDVQALGSSGSLLVAVGNAGLIRYSSNGVDWTAASSVPSSANLTGVAYSAAGYWVAVGEGGVVWKSTDAQSWTQATAASQSLRAVAVLPITVGTTTSYKLVAVGDGGLTGYSTDGVSWTWSSIATSNLTTVFAGGGQFMAAGVGGVLYTSTEGQSWSSSKTTGLSENAASVLRNAADNSWHLYGVNGAQAISR